MNDINGHRNGMTVENSLDAHLDASGLLCPLPVLKLRKRLQGLASGAAITMIATDPAAAIDVPHFCNEAGHQLLDQSQDGERLLFTIRKA